MSNDLQFIFKRVDYAKSSMTPSCREGHSMVALDEQTVLLFGGMSLQRENEVFLFDSKTKQWSTQPTSGQVPTARCFHSSFFDPPLMGVFGGEGEQGLSMNDFYLLDINTWTWKRLFVKRSPSPRHHCSVISQKSKEQVFFGGVSMPLNTLHNDTWQLDYSATDLSSKIPDAHCTLLSTKGEPPAPRSGHKSFLMNNCMVIVGGRTAVRKANTFLLHALNLSSLCWSTLKTIGCMPTSRSYFSLAPLDSDNYVLFGGKNNLTNEYLNELYVLNKAELFWENPYVAGKIPEARYHHATCHRTLSSGQHEMLMLGGLADGFLKMDILQLSLAREVKNEDWVKVEKVPPKLEYAQEVADNTIYDYKKQLCDLEITILDEKRTIAELKKKIQAQAESNAEELENNKGSIARLKREIAQTEEENQSQVKHFETLFLMVKQEELLSKEVKGRSRLLESTIQEIQQFMLSLDQVYLLAQQTHQAKPQLNEPLKALLDNSKAQVLQERNNYKDSLNFLKSNYLSIQQSLEEAQHHIDLQKAAIIQENREYEKILMETEVDEVL